MRQAESIFDDRTPVSTSTKRCRREFKIKWVGCDEPTWESPSNLLCCGLLALQPVVTDERSYCINILHMDLVNYVYLITLWDMD
ncbi:hypothetical protein F443_22485 [Phytophthora nicotianae P1569]|uniref:Chromo domain-containing protein n=1 Tax=Phytophthora nicotianae P1569 TaxID=1317065 RepID=V9DU68_PHYNI|nr:hypothetical protein F443_22485 [Phytophthora nicotianae P1569]